MQVLLLCWLSRRGGGGSGGWSTFHGSAVIYHLLQHADHTKWIQLGSAGWQAEVDLPMVLKIQYLLVECKGQGKLTEDELYAVVVFERVVFGGGNTEEALSDCGLFRNRRGRSHHRRLLTQLLNEKVLTSIYICFL